MEAGLSGVGIGGGFMPQIKSRRGSQHPWAHLVLALRVLALRQPRLDRPKKVINARAENAPPGPKTTTHQLLGPLVSRPAFRDQSPLAAEIAHIARVRIIRDSPNAQRDQ